MPGTSVAVVARAHGVNANQVFTWRKLHQSGVLGSTNPASAGEAAGAQFGEVTRKVARIPRTVRDERRTLPSYSV